VRPGLERLQEGFLDAVLGGGRVTKDAVQRPDQPGISAIAFSMVSVCMKFA